MIPLPPKIDPSVTMMQVEERPSITYADVGGCKEQIEKLREVVELPLLEVSIKSSLLAPAPEAEEDSRNVLRISVSSHRKVFCFMVLPVQVKHCAHEQ